MPALPARIKNPAQAGGVSGIGLWGLGLGRGFSNRQICYTKEIGL